MGNRLSRFLRTEPAKVDRRKCFISYFSADKAEVDKFLEQFGDVLIPRVIGVSDGDDFVNSDNSDYVMQRIREKYLGDSTVTICLIGKCTHSRRYIDWELKSTLRRGSYTPNGLLGILLPSMGRTGHLPPRFRGNWDEADTKYGLYTVYPDTPARLKQWIEIAYVRRTTRADRIVNSQRMFKYNRECRFHGVTH